MRLTCTRTPLFPTRPLQALRFLKANLTDDDLHALLDKLQIETVAGAPDSTISVSELAKLVDTGASAESSTGSSSSSAVAKDTVQIHTR